MQILMTKAAYERVGTYVVATDPIAFGELLKVEFAKWGKVVRDVKAQVN